MNQTDRAMLNIYTAEKQPVAGCRNYLKPGSRINRKNRIMYCVTGITMDSQFNELSATGPL